MYTLLFIAFRCVCCSISQRKNQQLGKILLKIYILNNAVKLDKYRYSNKWIVNYSQLLPHLKKMNRHESKMWKKYMQCLGIKKSVTPRKKWLTAGLPDWSRTNGVPLRSPSQMPKLYAKCPFLFIFVRFMQYFSSILHNFLLFKWWFLCLFVGSKTETLPKYYQFSQKIGYPQHIETPVFTRGK